MISARTTRPWCQYFGSLTEWYVDPTHDIPGQCLAGSVKSHNLENTTPPQPSHRLSSHVAIQLFCYALLPDEEDSLVFKATLVALEHILVRTQDHLQQLSILHDKYLMASALTFLDVSWC